MNLNKPIDKEMNCDSIISRPLLGFFFCKYAHLHSNDELCFSSGRKKKRYSDANRVSFLILSFSFHVCFGHDKFSKKIASFIAAFKWSNQFKSMWHCDSGIVDFCAGVRWQ